MNFMQSLFRKRLLAGTLVALLSSAIGLPLISLKAQAQGFGKPPSSSRSGGVRGGCFVAEKGRNLQALVLVNDESNLALTTQENPTLLFYLPFGQPAYGSPDAQNSVATTAEFELLDEEENSVLKNQIIVLSIPQKPGIFSLKIPSSEVRLEPNKKYFWVFRVICDREDPSANPNVSGTIKRVDSGSSNNIWLDYLDQIVRSRANNLEIWKKILVQFGIEDLAQSPIAELKPRANQEL